MTTEEKNKQTLSRLYNECLNKRNMELLDEIISEDYIGIKGLKGADGFKTPIIALIAAFPDIQWKTVDLVAEGDKVVIRWQWEGTQTGPFTFIAATNKHIMNDAIAIYDFKDGKVTSATIQTDRLGFLQQLDALPEDIATINYKKEAKENVSFIDKFFIPAAAKETFMERMTINRNFIKTLPGFIKDDAYTYTDDAGNLACVTIALWQDKQAVANAKEAVQAEYKRQGFDMAAMLKQWNITIDRGLYQKL